MSRYRMTLDKKLLDFQQGTSHRFVPSLTFIGRDFNALADYQVTGVTEVIGRVRRRVAAVLDEVSTARAIVASDPHGRGEPNAFVRMIREGGSQSLPEVLRGARGAKLLEKLSDVRDKDLAQMKGRRQVIDALAAFHAAGPIPVTNMGEGSSGQQVRMSAMKKTTTSTQPTTNSGPRIVSIISNPAMAGQSILIKGLRFGAEGPSSEIAIGFEVATISQWTTTQVRLVVPALSPGNYTISLTTDAGQSATHTVTVIPATTANPTGSSSGSGTAPAGNPPPVASTQTETGPDPKLIMALLESSLGYVFEDRLRVTPAGFALGEHVYTLGLAPGEEVTLEQKTFTKREVSLEEALEEDRSLDIETSSTVSTELTDSLALATSSNNKIDTSYGATFGASFKVGEIGFNGSASHNLAVSLASAASKTANSTSRRTLQKTSRAASKMRANHRTQFRVNAESRFERTTKRIIKNPNIGSSVSLQFFKMMSVVDLQLERTGVRLCWAPFVKNPGRAVLDRAAKAGSAAGETAANDYDAPPQPLAPPPLIQKRTVTTSAVTSLDDYFGFWNDMSIDVDVRIDAIGLDWDGSPPTLDFFFDDSRSSGAYTVGAPSRVGDQVVVRVHVGIDWTLGRRGHASVQVRIGLIDVQDEANAKLLADYRQEVAAWKVESRERERQALKAAGLAFQSASEQVRANYDAMTELVRNVIDSHFPIDIRDEFREVERWSQIFDFDCAGYSLFSGVWREDSLPIPERAASDFLNASWARVYLPIRIGEELEALRLAFGGRNEELDATREAKIKTLLSELSTYRVNHFGSEEEITLDRASKKLVENFEVLARWQDSVPTDGTHCESVLGVSTALDEQAEQLVTDAAKLRSSALALQQANADIKTKGLSQMKGDVAPEIRIGSGDDES